MPQEPKSAELPERKNPNEPHPRGSPSPVEARIDLEYVFPGLADEVRRILQVQLHGEPSPRMQIQVHGKLSRMRSPVRRSLLRRLWETGSVHDLHTLFVTSRELLEQKAALLETTSPHRKAVILGRLWLNLLGRSLELALRDYMHLRTLHLTKRIGPVRSGEDERRMNVHLGLGRPASVTAILRAGALRHLQRTANVTAPSAERTQRRERSNLITPVPFPKEPSPPF
ncbi:hypothetical protein [Thermosulfurimonas sp. F29]|uniref:hypothetical protein n=1 Tax=Thermosulfurimonas sp. F29 TaxID=2867247 RepID=UPI001C83A620|nr:hypothetical protein [Thermosulfurimonas sp. F29]MBX6423388.1 hypothetical protein [Thermosulfurimonas sp. F29]